MEFIDQESRIIVGYGQTLQEQEIAIVDPATLTRCPPEKIGEILVSGPSVTQGYWKRLNLTQETFIKDTKDGPFLRTGDLGFLSNLELFIISRLKDLIIIRGKNHSPVDIEWTVQQSHPSVRPHCCAAFSVEIDGEERLVIVTEVEKRQTDRTRGERQLERRKRLPDEASHSNSPVPFDSNATIRAIREAVAKEHELKTYSVGLIKPGSIPKTTSGKIQRNLCKQYFLEKKLEPIDMGSQQSEKARQPTP